MKAPNLCLVQAISFIAAKRGHEAVIMRKGHVSAKGNHIVAKERRLLSLVVQIAYR